MGDKDLRIGVSACLLGQKVRHDGGHKHSRYLTEVLGPFFDLIPVCPEAEVGMGTPRESVRLVGEVDAPAPGRSAVGRRLDRAHEPLVETPGQGPGRREPVGLHLHEALAELRPVPRAGEAGQRPTLAGSGSVRPGLHRGLPPCAGRGDRSSERPAPARELPGARLRPPAGDVPVQRPLETRRRGRLPQPRKVLPAGAQPEALQGPGPSGRSHRRSQAQRVPRSLLRHVHGGPGRQGHPAPSLQHAATYRRAPARPRRRCGTRAHPRSDPGLRRRPDAPSSCRSPC